MAEDLSTLEDMDFGGQQSRTAFADLNTFGGIPRDHPLNKVGGKNTNREDVRRRTSTYFDVLRRTSMEVRHTTTHVDVRRLKSTYVVECSRAST